MTIAGKDRIALEKLLRLAREDSADLSEDLADVAAARAAAALSLSRMEEAGAAEAPARRRRLAATLATLEKAERQVREKLEAAGALVIRLEALMARAGEAPKAAETPAFSSRTARAL